MAYAPVYGPCCKIVLVKEFPYRAETAEEFSSAYTFAPVNIPSNDTQWQSFVDFVRGQELGIYSNLVKFNRAYGYNSNDPHAAHVYVRDWVALGQVATGQFVPSVSDSRGAGDQAACVEWLFRDKSAKGKPVYARKYHHEPYMGPGGGDTLASEYVAALQTYANTMRTYLGGPYSTKYPTNVTTLGKVLPYVTTRTLRRRGKRPRPSP